MKKKERVCFNWTNWEVKDLQLVIENGKLKELSVYVDRRARFSDLIKKLKQKGIPYLLSPMGEGGDKKNG